MTNDFREKEVTGPSARKKDASQFKKRPIRDYLK